MSRALKRPGFGSFWGDVAVVTLAIVLAFGTLVITFRPTEKCRRLIQTMTRTRALEDWADTTLLFDEQMHFYLNSYAQHMRGFTAQLVSQEDAEQMVRSQLAPLVRNSLIFLKGRQRMHAAFPSFTCRGLDWNQLDARERKLFDDFIISVAAAYAGGADPALDPGSKSAYRAYIDFRKEILDGCRNQSSDSVTGRPPRHVKSCNAA